MLLLVALIIGSVLAAGVVPAYWSNSIASELNPAPPGSRLLSQLGVVSSYALWLNPLRMVGMAFLFTAITLALTVIIGTLPMQARLLWAFTGRPAAKPKLPAAMRLPASLSSSPEESQRTKGLEVENRYIRPQQVCVASEVRVSVWCSLVKVGRLC